MQELALHTIANASDGSGAETAEYCLQRIDKFGELNAFISVQREIPRPPKRGGTPGRHLNGAPIALKDLIDVAGELTTAASAVFAERRAERDADVVRRLRAAGAFLIGKTNLHECAYGGSGVITAYGPPRNPWNTAHITGGSSSGAAAAVASGMCAAAVGTDTAGSIRLPASFCGFVGFKGSYGAVSLDGIVPLAESLDHCGPMTRTVADARMLFEILSGAQAPVAKRMTRLRIGIPEAFFFRDLDAEVAAVVEAAVKATRAAGHELVTRDFPVDEDRTLAMYEAYQYHKGWAEESPELYLPETLRRIRAGENITAEEAQQAVAKLDETRRSAGEIFDGIDVLLTATVPVLPPTIDDLLGNPDTLRPRELVMLRNTRPFNVLGIPAINLPWDVSRGGLPVGIQLAAAPGKDFELLDIAEEFEKISPWQGRTPPQFA